MENLINDVTCMLKENNNSFSSSAVNVNAIRIETVGPCDLMDVNSPQFTQYLSMFEKVDLQR